MTNAVQVGLVCMGKGDTFVNALIGGVVTVIFSFTGVSPILGGVIAGYLQQETRRSGAKVGAYSGLIAFVLFLFILILGFGFFVVGSMMGGIVGLPGVVELFIILFLLFPPFLLWSIGLGAVGGFLGTYLREEYSDLNNQSMGR